MSKPEDFFKGGPASPRRLEFHDGLGLEGAKDATTQAGSESGSHTQAPASRLWLWFVTAFALQIAVWTAWFVVAAKNKVAEVPLASRASAR